MLLPSVLGNNHFYIFINFRMIAAFKGVRESFEGEPPILYAGFPYSKANARKEEENAFHRHLQRSVQWPEWLLYDGLAQASTSGPTAHVARGNHWSPSAGKMFGEKLIETIIQLCTRK